VERAKGVGETLGVSSDLDGATAEDPVSYVGYYGDGYYRSTDQSGIGALDLWVFGNSDRHFGGMGGLDYGCGVETRFGAIGVNKLYLAGGGDLTVAGYSGVGNHQGEGGVWITYRAHLLV